MIMMMKACHGQKKAYYKPSYILLFFVVGFLVWAEKATGEAIRHHNDKHLVLAFYENEILMKRKSSKRIQALAAERKLQSKKGKKSENSKKSSLELDDADEEDSPPPHPELDDADEKDSPPPHPELDDADEKDSPLPPSELDDADEKDWPPPPSELDDADEVDSPPSPSELHDADEEEADINGDLPSLESDEEDITNKDAASTTSEKNSNNDNKTSASFSKVTSSLSSSTSSSSRNGVHYLLGVLIIVVVAIGALHEKKKRKKGLSSIIVNESGMASPFYTPNSDGTSFASSDTASNISLTEHLDICVPIDDKLRRFIDNTGDTDTVTSSFNGSSDESTDAYQHWEMV